MKILVQFPTFARPKKFLDCIKEWLITVGEDHSIHINVNCDSDDKTMNNSEMIKVIKSLPTKFNLSEVVTLDLFFDKNTSKISAINDHINSKVFDFDIVICASDDMIPQKRPWNEEIFGWDERIVYDMMRCFPDLSGALHYNDGYQGKNLITLSILGRKLYDYFGYIYHPDYKSLYCDDEFTREVRRLGKVAYVDELLIKHEHYAEKENRNSGDMDESAKKTLYYSGRDGYVFQKRKELGFPKQRITGD